MPGINKNINIYNKKYFNDKTVTLDEDGKGFSWEDEYGTNHVYEDPSNRTLLRHDITGTDGTTQNYGQKFASTQNAYITRLWEPGRKAGKKTAKTQQKQAKTVPVNNTPVQPQPASANQKVIVVKDENGNDRKVGVSSDTEVTALTGSAVANSFAAIAQAQVGDFWIDKNNNIHVVTQGDIDWSKAQLEKQEETPPVKEAEPEDDKEFSDSKENSESQTDLKTYLKGNLKSNVGNGNELPDDPEELRKEIAGIEDKGMDRVIPSTSRRYQELTKKLAEITGDAADRAKAVAAENAALGKNPVLYKNPYDAITETAASRERAEEDTKNMEGRPKAIRGILPEFLAGDYGNYHKAKIVQKEYYDVYDDKGNLVTKTPVDKEAAEIMIDRAKYDNLEYQMKPNPEYTRYFIYDNDGRVYGASMSEKEANYMKNDLDEETKAERKRAWAELLGRSLNSFATANINSANDVLGQANVQSLHQQDLEDRIKGNNELYYKNELAKNENIRNLTKLSDEELAKIVGNSNNNVALLTYLIGEKRVNNIMDILGKQELEQSAAQAMAKWTPEQKNAYYTWTALVNDRDINDKLAGLISGKTSIDYYANLWKKQTNIKLAKDSAELQALEKAIEAAGLQNKLTNAQVDVIRELVAEQLQAAKLSNAQTIQQMATSSVDSLAKVIDAIIPL